MSRVFMEKVHFFIFLFSPHFLGQHQFEALPMLEFMVWLNIYLKIPI